MSTTISRLLRLKSPFSTLYHPGVYHRKNVAQGPSRYFFVRMISTKSSLILQHDVAPVVRLVLSIAPAGRRIHRVSRLDLDGPAVHRFVAVPGRPACFIQSPADQQQGARRRQKILPTSHVSPPYPIKSAAFPRWRRFENGVLRGKERRTHPPHSAKQHSGDPLFSAAIGGPLYDISTSIATGTAWIVERGPKRRRLPVRYESSPFTVADAATSPILFVTWV